LLVIIAESSWLIAALGQSLEQAHPGKPPVDYAQVSGDACDSEIVCGMSTMTE